MNLVRCMQPRGFDSPVSRMNHFFQNFDNDFFSENRSLEKAAFSPNIDIKEDEKNIFLIAEVPGIDKENIKVSVDKDGVLLIKGEKKQEEKVENENYIKIERSYGEFSRSFILPENIKQDEINAEYKNGILRIVLEKVEPEKPKEIEVNIN